VRVKVEGVCALDSRHEVSELGTDESRACRKENRIVNIDSQRQNKIPFFFLKVHIVEVKRKYNYILVGKFI
jgi:hypothetical protein